MPKKADTSTKRLVSLHQDDWARWLMRDEAVVVQAMLSSDFQWIQRESDIILRAEHPTEGVFLLVNEVQLRYELPMPVRLMVYSILGEEKYQLPVYPVLINILPPSPNVVIPDHYESSGDVPPVYLPGHQLMGTGGGGGLGTGNLPAHPDGTGDAGGR